MSPYEELMTIVRQTSLLGSTASLLRWDQETMLPPGGVEHRSRQLAQLAGLIHERATAPRVGELIEACEQSAGLTADPASDAGANLRELRRGYDRATRLPAALVQEKAQIRTLAQHAWGEARQKSDFSIFQPFLEKSLALARRTAECYGWPSNGEPWDALADDYEQGMTAAGVAEVFGPLRDRLQTLLDDLMSGTKRPTRAFMEVRLPVAAQQAFIHHVAERMGFAFSSGRLDLSAHPFCSGLHPGDVRLTFRHDERGVSGALAAVMHEAGHGLYYQGLPLEHVGTPLGGPASVGINESQSRMWENQVGRSEAFWRWCAGELRRFFGDAVSQLSLADVYGGVNLVERSLIRVDADEVTYNLHITVRFELERALLSGDLEVAALPGEWNRRYKEYLGMTVPDDALGCLQDIHWSMGAFGYFPTYTIGNLYCAQLFEKALADVPDLYEAFAQGDFSGLKSWLNRNVHAHGSRYLPDELCRRVTGRPLSADALVRYLEGKLRPLYGA
jgi:carboxypeptidase Taq